MNDRNELILVLAQVGMAFVLLLGVFSLVFVLILFHTDLGTTIVTIITGVIATLGTVLTLSMNYFYARQRPPSLPDPATTTFSSTTTTQIASPSPGDPNVAQSIKVPATGPLPTGP